MSRRRYSSSWHTHYSSQSAADTLSGHTVSTDAKQQHGCPRTHTSRHTGHALPPAGRGLAHRSVRFRLGVFSRHEGDSADGGGWKHVFEDLHAAAVLNVFLTHFNSFCYSNTNKSDYLKLILLFEN